MNYRRRSGGNLESFIQEGFGGIGLDQRANGVTANFHEGLT
jgi:hypothetical protein